MLREKNITYQISEISEIKGKAVCQFTAIINSTLPLDLELNRNILDKEAYKTARFDSMKDQEAFETAVYELQEKLLQEEN